MARYNALIGELEGVIGRKIPLERIARNPLIGGIGQKLPFVGQFFGQTIGMITGLLDSVLGMLTGGIFGGGGKKKKAKVNQLTAELERLQARLSALQSVLERLAGAINQLVHTGNTIREAQKVRIAQDMAKSEDLYRQSRTNQRLQAQAHAQKASLYESLYPSRGRQKGPDAL